MSNEMRMSDIFGLPLAVCRTNPQMITAKPTRKGVIDHHSATIRSPQHSEVAYAAHAINNHDRLVEENAKLREALAELVETSDMNEAQLSQELLEFHEDSAALSRAKKLLSELGESK